MPIILVTGGARSGKSSYAEQRCRRTNQSVVYIACAKITDDDMAARIAQHKAQRPSEWRTVERYKALDDIIKNASEDVFLLDCVTTMITNLMFDDTIDFETCDEDEISTLEKKITKEIDALLDAVKSSKTLIVVTNEVGMGLVPAYRLGSIFRDIAGRINQRIAKQADEVICMMSGLPLKLK